ncbi:hypothetical protein [Thalassotalea sediminis]|uniref:hypothetical protein n=1 Tax=Thalassotalea sediminis TaxID=1759089 RepID=UPI0025733FF7|nr:hypothetical protein [Thalassotalea sediminis]
MKNLLILIVAIALFLHFYPQPELEEWYLEQKDYLLSTFNDATDTKVRLNPNKVYRDLESKLERFNESEHEYVKQITSSRNSVKTFFAEYCTEKKRSPKLHQENQKVVCNTIAKYQSLF